MQTLKKIDVFNRLKIFLIRIILFFIFLELGLMILCQLDIFIVRFPSYNITNSPNFLSKFDKDIGFVHEPNSSFVLKNNCIDVTYSFNSLGFLDTERPEKSKQKRILFLGDSFTEGYGVSIENRTSNILENLIKTPCINCALTDKGPAQYQEIYRKYSSKYTHDALVIALYPANDFIDDNAEQYKTFYRPYWKKVNEEWVFINPGKENTDKQKPNIFKRILLNFTYSYNLYLYLKSSLKHESNINEIGHFNFSEADWERLEQSIKTIRILAPGKEILLYTIPSKTEIALTNLNESPLFDKLKLLCESIDIQFLNLASQIASLELSEKESLYKTCDTHWSEKGNKYAANYILKNWRYLQNN